MGIFKVRPPFSAVTDCIRSISLSGAIEISSPVVYAYQFSCKYGFVISSAGSPSDLSIACVEGDSVFDFGPVTSQYPVSEGRELIYPMARASTTSAATRPVSTAGVLDLRSECMRNQANRRNRVMMRRK